jgi:hypothetical protein
VLGLVLREQVLFDVAEPLRDLLVRPLRTGVDELPVRGIRSLPDPEPAGDVRQHLFLHKLPLVRCDVVSLHTGTEQAFQKALLR